MAHGAAPPTARLTIWEVWRRTTVQFVSDTNLAGVNNAGRSRHPLRKAVWCCLWVAGLGVTLSDVTMLVRKYLSFPVSTDYSIDSDGTVTFPAVTVCNQNSVMCTDLVRQLLIIPDDAHIEELVNRSSCLERAEKLCVSFFMDFLHHTNGTLPRLLQNTDCFRNSVDNCCSAVEYGEMHSTNITGHLRALGCNEDHLMNCGGPGGPDPDPGREAEQGSPGQSAGQGQKRPKRSAETPERKSQRSSTLIRKKRKVGPHQSESPKHEMGKDDTYEEKIGFYRSFMNLSVSRRILLGQVFDSFVMSCTFNGRDCRDIAFFNELSNPEYGNCFTFNSNISSGTADEEAGKRASTMTGPNNGLSMVLFVDTGNYMRSSVTQTKGARMAIHPSDVTPLMAEAGLEIMPATVTSVSISESHIIRMPSPYSSHCVSEWSDTRLQPHVIDATTDVTNVSAARYTLPECQRICLQLRMVRTCGCHDPLYPLAFAVDGEPQDTGPSCDLSFNTTDKACTDRVAESMGHSDSADCVCSKPCFETVHQPQLSVASWPQGDYLGNLLHQLDFLSVDASDEELAKLMGNEFAKINVYFRDLSIATVTESATYTYSSFISGLGGALSLYLGIALILLVELLELLFFLAYDTVRFLCGCYPAQHEAFKPHWVAPVSNQGIRVVLTDEPGRKVLNIQKDAQH